MTYLVAGFGETLAHELPGLKALGVRGIRQGGRTSGTNYLDPDRCVELAQEVLNAGMRCYFSCFTVPQVAAMSAVDGLSLGWMNEPDLESIPAAEYAASMKDASELAMAKGIPFYVGEISNFNRRGFDYLKVLMPAVDALEWSVRVSMHRYQVGPSWYTPHEPFLNRYDEAAAFKSLIGGRRFAITEFGFHTGRRTWGGIRMGSRRFFGSSGQYADQDVLQAAIQESTFWEIAGADFSVWYQFQDGTTPEDSYGIRRRDDGQWKPVSALFNRVEPTTDLAGVSMNSD